MSRILVVEDEPAIAELVAVNLRYAGHEVVPVADVRDYLERFREMIESRGAPSGGWRGEVHGGQPTEGGGFEPGTGMGTRATGPAGAETISEGTYGSGAYGENTISEQITDPIPPQVPPTTPMPVRWTSRGILKDGCPTKMPARWAWRGSSPNVGIIWRAGFQV